MASFGAVLKNGILFIILSAPFLFAGAALLVVGLGQLLITYNLPYQSGTASEGAAIRNLFFALLAIVGGSGLIYLKSMSDTVEEGMLY